MSTAAMKVRDVRPSVRDAVRPICLLAVGLCGMCGIALTRRRGRVHGRKEMGTVRAPARAYGCPHIPHIPHNAWGATPLRVSHAARDTAHPAPAVARAFSSVTACSKKMNEGVVRYGF